MLPNTNAVTETYLGFMQKGMTAVRCANTAYVTFLLKLKNLPM